MSRSAHNCQIKSDTFLVSFEYVRFKEIESLALKCHETHAEDCCVLIFTRLLCVADLAQPQLATLALNLWNLSQKHGFGNTKYTVSEK